jgi:hypothetical protein
MATMSYYTKRAVKGTGGPIGFPQPVRWIDCGCGTCVPMPGMVDKPSGGACCQTCGTVYDGRGFIDFSFEKES